ncbi:hypothetical protein [Brevibacillus brevis]|uniref:PepSY domain-containing protein n=1 Tax=Brevibacillus brevis TaxID=1393 RepID=A0ABY9T5A0_BREBE|nr:hypothetical protein [Brevibacillus brevis]WNC15264.1 hypothetical protein RGB73_02485 [Brevibacillus brevis]
MKKQTLLAVSMMALLLSAASPFTSMPAPAYAAQQASPAEEQMKTLAQLDQKVVEEARQAMQKLAGNVKIELQEITGANNECWVISAKDHRGEVLVTKKEGKVVSANVTFQPGEVPAQLMQTATSTLQSMDSKRAVAFDIVQRNSWEKENSWIFVGRDGKSVTIDAATEKVKHAKLEYETINVDPNVPEVDSKIADAAKKALKTLSNGSASELSPRATLYKSPEMHRDQVWGFMDKEANYRIEIGAKTGKVVAVSNTKEIGGGNFVLPEDVPTVFAKPFYTKEKAIAAANPMLKKMFHLDLTGYTVTTKYNEYTFAKKGKPTVTALINKKGVFYDYTVAPENGLIN